MRPCTRTVMSNCRSTVISLEASFNTLSTEVDQSQQRIEGLNLHTESGRELYDAEMKCLLEKISNLAKEVFVLNAQIKLLDSKNYHYTGDIENLKRQTVQLTANTAELWATYTILSNIELAAKKVKDLFLSQLEEFVKHAPVH